MQLAKHQHRRDRGDSYRPDAGGDHRPAATGGKPAEERHLYPFIRDLVDVDRIRDVFYTALAAVREKELGQGARLIVDALADAYRSRRRQGLEPSRDIDAVSVNVALIDQDVARVDPDPQLDTVLLLLIRLSRGKPALDIERTTYRVDRARELDQQSVAHAAHETSVIFVDCRLDQFTRMASKARMRLVLAAAHHAAVIDDIGQHNGHQSPTLRRPARLPSELVRELTNSTAIEGPQSIVITIRAPAEAQKLQQWCTAKACLGGSSIPGPHICDTKSLIQNRAWTGYRGLIHIEAVRRRAGYLVPLWQRVGAIVL